MPELIRVPMRHVGLLRSAADGGVIRTNRVAFAWLLAWLPLPPFLLGRLHLRLAGRPHLGSVNLHRPLGGKQISLSVERKERPDNFLPSWPQGNDALLT